MKHRNALARSFTVLLICAGGHLLPAQCNGRWNVRETIDQMTDKKAFDAHLLASCVSDRGRIGTVEVTATCGAEGVALDIVYVSDTDKKMGFQQVQPDASIDFNQVHVPKPRVNMRLRIDDAAVRTISAQSDHVNEAALFFAELSPGQAMADMRGPSGSGDNTPLLRLFVSAQSAGTSEELFGSRLIRLELPLANGDAPVLRITPREDPEFQKFAARCKAEYPNTRQTFIPGASPFSAPFPPGIAAVLGDHRLIPPAGARFYAVEEEEAQKAVIKWAHNWYVGGCTPSEDEGPPPAVQSPAIIPGKTVVSAVESGKPRFIVASPSQNSRELQLLAVAVHGKSGLLVKLADGRFGLIPRNDLFQGYTDYARKMEERSPPQPPRKPTCDLPADDRVFNGTVEEFAKAFPDLLKRAAADWQLDPQSFGPETAYILDLARTCVQITPEMLDSVRNPVNDEIDLKKLANGRFQQCNSMNIYVSQVARNLPAPQAVTGRGVELAGPRLPAHWPDGESITLRIKFDRLPSDPYDPSHPYPPAYWITYATIKRSAAAH